MFKLKDFFYLQRNDRQAILVLLGIIIVCSTLVFVIGHLDSSYSPNDKASTILQSDSSLTYGKRYANDVSEKKPLYYKIEGIPHELFPFDPNTADSAQLLKLGLQSWQVRSIYHYRAKGGIFRSPSDFARIYGLTKKQYEVLAPFIRIGEDYRPAADYYGKREGRQATYHDDKDRQQSSESIPSDKKVYSYPHKLSPGQHIDINTADTTELMKIPGIGSYYAKRIVRYREQLGGFAFPSQLKEIEGVPESVLLFITIDTRNIQKLHLNSLSINQLRKHPYINFYQAKAICDYRHLKGPIKDLQELKLLKDFPPAEIERIQPYIAF